MYILLYIMDWIQYKFSKKLTQRKSQKFLSNTKVIYDGDTLVLFSLRILGKDTLEINISKGRLPDKIDKIDKIFLSVESYK